MTGDGASLGQEFAPAPIAAHKLLQGWNSEIRMARGVWQNTSCSHEKIVSENVHQHILTKVYKNPQIHNRRKKYDSKYLPQ